MADPLVLRRCQAAEVTSEGLDPCPLPGRLWSDEYERTYTLCTRHRALFEGVTVEPGPGEVVLTFHDGHVEEVAVDLTADLQLVDPDAVRLAVKRLERDHGPIARVQGKGLPYAWSAGSG